MNETEFRDEFCSRIKGELTRYRVFASGKEINLIYRMIIDGNGEILPKDVKNPARGYYAFQTDILIKNEMMIPLVAIETKYSKITTHDILTYSTKAVKHKEIYPYLRYGLIIGDLEGIPDKFFIHNQGFDFAASLKDINNEEELNRIIAELKEQIGDAEKVLQILDKKRKTKLFARKIRVEV